LNEVFFDDVRVRVGKKTVVETSRVPLGHERTGIARLGKSKERVKFAKEAAPEMRANGKPLIKDQAFRLRVAQLETDIKALEITQFRVVSAYEKKEAGAPDPLSSAPKIKGSELLQATTGLANGCRRSALDTGLGAGIGGAQQQAGTRARLGELGD
jgi:alkylation response protein AidB-like acyl-CoA dehydrogenase